MLNRKEERFEQCGRENGLLLLFHLLSLLTLSFSAMEPANHHSLFIILFHYIYRFSIKFFIYGFIYFPCHENIFMRGNRQIYWLIDQLIMMIERQVDKWMVDRSQTNIEFIFLLKEFLKNQKSSWVKSVKREGIWIPFLYTWSFYNFLFFLSDSNWYLEKISLDLFINSE